MKSNKDFFDFGKEQLDNLKEFVEDFEKKLEKGAKEAKKSFEEDFKQFSQYMKDKKEQFTADRGETIEQLKVLKEAFVAFSTALKKEVPKTKKAFTNYQEKIQTSILDLEIAIKKAKPYYSISFGMRVAQFKAKLDNYRIEVLMVETPDQEKLNAERIKLAEALEYMKKRIDWEEEKTSKFDLFTEEINASVEHIKKTFSDIFK